MTNVDKILIGVGMFMLVTAVLSFIVFKVYLNLSWGSLVYKGGCLTACMIFAIHDLYTWRSR